MSKRKGIRKWIALGVVVGVIAGFGATLIFHEPFRNAAAGLTTDQIMNQVWNQTDDTLKITVDDLEIASQTDDLKITLDTEEVVVKAAATQANDLKVTLDGEEISQAAKSGKVLVADGQIKASAGSLYALTISCDGVTAGDQVEVKNSTDNSGTALFTIVAQAADAVYTPDLGPGIAFDTGIYSDETKTGGTITVSAVYE